MAVHIKPPVDLEVELKYHFINIQALSFFSGSPTPYCVKPPAENSPNLDIQACTCAPKHSFMNSAHDVDLWSLLVLMMKLLDVKMV